MIETDTFQNRYFDNLVNRLNFLRFGRKYLLIDNLEEKNNLKINYLTANLNQLRVQPS